MYFKYSISGGRTQGKFNVDKLDYLMQDTHVSALLPPSNIAYLTKLCKEQFTLNHEMDRVLISADTCCQLSADCGKMTADDNVLSGEKLKTGHLSGHFGDICRTFVHHL